MTAQRHPAPPTPLSDRQCPRCTHERNLRLGSERVRGLYLTDLIRIEDENRALRQRLAGLTTRPTRAAQAEEWAYGAMAGAVLAVEAAERRVRAIWRSLTDPATKHDSWALPIALGVGAAIFLLTVLVTSK